MEPIPPEKVLDYLKAANGVATVNGQPQDMTTLRGRTKSKEIYEATTSKG